MPETTEFKQRTLIDDIRDVLSFFGEQRTPKPVQSYYTDPRYKEPMGPPIAPLGTTETEKFNTNLFNRVMRGEVSGVPQYIAQEAARKTTTAPRPTGMDFANPEDMVLPAPTVNKASSVVDSALDAGQQIARDQNRVTNETFLPRAREQESGFFGNLGGPQTMDFVKRILQIMARPEFQDPEGIAAGVAGAAYGIKQDELKAQKAQREEQKLANEAAQLQFLNQLRIAEARRDEERLRLAQEAAGKPKSTALPTDKEFSKGVVDLVKRMGKDYIKKESSITGPSKTDIAREIAAEARSLVSRSGGTITIREAVQEILAIRQGKTSSTAGTSADAFGDL
jgi:hypothetical protein